MKAKDVMTQHVITIAPDASIVEALRLMLQHRISGLPVVDNNGTLAGIVTEGDFLRRAETGTEHKRPRWIEFVLGPGTLAKDYVHSHCRRIDEVMTTIVRTVAGGRRTMRHRRRHGKIWRQARSGHARA